MIEQYPKVEITNKKKLFKQLIFYLFHNYLGFFLSEKIVKKIIPTEKEFDSLVKNKVLIKEGKEYALGPNGLLLVNSWRIEKLTIIMVIISLMVLGFEILSCIKI